MPIILKCPCTGLRLQGVVYSLLTTAILSLLAGFTFSYSSPTLLELRQLEDPAFRFGSTLSDIFGASSLVGSIVGAFLAGIVADFWGRKASMALNCIPYLVGYSMMMVTYLIYEPIAFQVFLIIGRGISGVGTGWSIILVPIYISEIAPFKIRGLLVVFLETATTSGILLVYGLGAIPHLTYYNIALVPIALVAFFVMLFLWIPESPRWLIIKHKDHKQATCVLKFIYGPTKKTEIEAVIKDIESTSTSQKLSFLQSLSQLFCHKMSLIPFIIGLFIVVMQQLCGIGIVVNYAAQILYRAGDSNPNFTAFFAAGLLFPLMSLPVIVLVECIGKKLLLIISMAGMSIACCLLGFQYYFTSPSMCLNGTAVEDNSAKVHYCNSHLLPMAVTGVVLFSASFEIGVGPLVWVIFSEYIPVQVKGLAGGIILAANRGTGVLLTGTYFNFSEWTEDWVIWAVLAFFNLLGLVFTAVFAVETKGKKLEEVPELFKKKFPNCFR